MNNLIWQMEIQRKSGKKNRSSMTCGTIHNALTYAKIELWLTEDVYCKPCTVTKNLKIIKSKKEIQLNLLRNNPRKAEK